MSLGSITAEQLAHLAKVTLAELGENKWTDIALDLQEYCILPKLLKKNKVQIESGESIEKRVKTGNSGNAKMVGLYGVDQTNEGTDWAVSNIPWRHAEASWVLDKRKISMNRQPRRIVSLVKGARHGAMSDLAELMEDQGWSSTLAAKDSYGIPMWITVPASYTADGFTGANPSGFSSGIGLDSTAQGNENWKNWHGQYASVTKSDLIRRMRESSHKTHFKAPVPHDSYEGSKDSYSDNYGYYTDYDTLELLTEEAEKQNDNLGMDVAPADGKVVFMRRPITWVPKLDNITVFSGHANPIFGVCWDCMEYTFLEGEYMRESAPAVKSGQHNVVESFVDLTFNLNCTNRRRNFVLTKAAA
ncbi:MAG: phage major capsid protein [Planctomycetota bacterium]